MSDNIEFWSIADNSKISVPRSQCELEVILTPKGPKRRLSVVFTTSDGKVRKLSKFVKEDFQL